MLHKEREVYEVRNLFLLAVFVLLIANIANAQSVEGFGEAPLNPQLTFSEAKLIAREAAILDVKKQTNGEPYRIIHEMFLEGGIYFIRAEI